MRKGRGKISAGAFIGGLAAGGVIATGAFMAGEHHDSQQLLSPATPSASASLSLGKGVPILGMAENTISDITAKVSDSVVNIDTRRSITLPVGQMDPYQSFFFGPGMGMDMPQARPRKLEQKGTGSGVIFRGDGYILTNNHVVGDADEIEVTLNDKRKFKGKVVGRDDFTDLALVKVDGTNLPAATFGTSANIRPGDWAIAIGSPLGLDHTVTLGIISALNRSVENKINNVELIQTDAAINPGNSGGPLLNIHGEVIGITTAIRGDAQNIGFAIPVDVAKDVAQQLLNNGTIARPYVGIYMQDINAQLAKSLGLPANIKGVLVYGSKQGSPADQAGLVQGDVIVRIDNIPVSTSKELQALVRKHKPGDAVTVLVARGNAMSPVTIKVGQFPTKRRDE
jgi:S1-C subfamily serine protease